MTVVDDLRAHLSRKPTPTRRIRRTGRAFRHQGRIIEVGEIVTVDEDVARSLVLIQAKAEFCD